MKNIWIFNHHALAPSSGGGTRHFEFSRELVNRGYEVTIFASGFTYHTHLETQEYGDNYYKEEIIDGVKFVWIKTPPYYKNNWRRILGMLVFAQRSYKAAIDRMNKPDVVIGSTVHLLAVDAARKIAAKYKAKFIMEVRDLWPATLIDMGVARWHPMVLWFGALERRLYRQAGHIITLLPKANEYIEDLGHPPEKITWIPNGVNCDKFKPAEELNYQVKGKFTVTYTGAMGTANYLEFALRSATVVLKKNPSVKFQMIGDGPLKGKLQKMAAEMELTNVEFLPPVNKSDIPGILQNSDAQFAVVRNLKLYRFGLSFNKLFDYLAAGKPILFASNAVNDPVGEAGAGYTVSPDDPVLFAEAVLEMAELPDRERKQMGTNGQAYVKEYFSIKVLVDRLEEVLQKND